MEFDMRYNFPYFLENVNTSFKTAIIGDLSVSFEPYHFSGVPFRVISGEKILCTNMLTKEYFWMEELVILVDHSDNKYIFDMTAYSRLIRGSSRRLIALDNLKLILNATLVKEEQAASVIQKAFKHLHKRKQSAITIQRRVLKYLYRPGGELFKRRKLNFESNANNS
jgi:hypothetical protein